MSDSISFEPSVLYFGTPVALISTLNPDGSPNLSPNSSLWALGHRIILGMATSGRGLENIERLPECVVNLPSAAMWEHVERIAETTGVSDIPRHKRAAGYRFEPDKFRAAGLSAVSSLEVRPPRIAECPIQIEARVLSITAPTRVRGDGDGFRIVEARMAKFHAHTDIVHPGTPNIDTGRWQPLLYVFRHYFGTGPRLARNFRAET